MHIVLMRFAATILLFALAGCYSVQSYEGDGKLRDNGFLVGMGERYLLDLGTIPLTEPKTLRYKMANFPGYTFVAGLHMKESVEVVRTVHTHVRLQVINDSTAEKFIDVQGELKDWTHHYAAGENEPVDAYMAGKTTNERLGAKDTWEDTPVYIGADCGWGTYFRPQDRTGYTLVVTVTPAVESPVREAEIMLEDVGPAPPRCD